MILGIEEIERRVWEEEKLFLMKQEGILLIKNSAIKFGDYILASGKKSPYFSDLMSRELMGPIGSPVYHEYVADILQSDQLLLDHVNGILDLSRIESGKHDLHIDRVTLADAWTPIAGTLAATAAAKGIELRLLEPTD